MRLMKITTILVLVTNLALTAFAQQPRQTTGLKDPPWLEEERDKRIVYTAPGMGQVNVQKDVTYKCVENTELKMDVYFPPGLSRGEQRPVVIFIHGGSLPSNLLTQPKEWGEFRSFGELMAVSGFVAVTFNHRFYNSLNSLPDSQSDLLALIDYLRSHADTFQINKDCITLWTFSGGGLLLTQAMRESPPYIRALVAYYTTLDLKFIEKARPGTIAENVMREFSPLNLLEDRGKAIPPIFVVRAGLDRPETNAVIDQFLQLAIIKNVNIDFSNHMDGHHGFDILDNNDRSRHIIQRTVEFIRAYNQE
ncbi:MAG: alpha/beta hydrolase [Acidobacteriota bacterium]